MFYCNVLYYVTRSLRSGSTVAGLTATMEGRLRTDRFKNWVLGIRKKYRKPSPNLSVFASKRSLLIRHLPNNITLREVFLQDYIFGRVRDLLITPVEQRPNSSRFPRIEFFRKENCEQFEKILIIFSSLLVA